MTKVEEDSKDFTQVNITRETRFFVALLVYVSLCFQKWEIMQAKEGKNLLILAGNILLKGENIC